MNELEPTIKLSRGNAIKGGSKGVKSSVKGSSSSGNSADRVTLSESSRSKVPAQGSKSKTGEIRLDLVNKFRDVLQNGSYAVKADEIADKIVQKIRDNKNHLLL